LRVLLDACVPRKLARELLGYDVRTVPNMGWGDLDDGALLGQMADLFDALVTVDKNIPAQQNIRTRSFGVIILRAKTNRLADLIPLVPELRSALEILMPGEIRELGK
jgi:hypothetical protein